jgi:hypothetical protein
MPEKIDLYKTHKAEYAARKDPALVEVGPAKYLTIDGRGEPGGEAFQASLGALYGVAYTIKMTRKFGGGPDYKVCGLEGLWWCPNPMDWMNQPRDSWEWKLMLRVPEFITGRDLKAALEQLKKKGKGDGAAQVRLETIREGRSVQVLHVGPYANEPETIARMKEFAQSQGLEFRGKHHEIYLSDPRRVPPERLRTILRMPVA